ncbi:hypothetical protein QPL79_02505 [Ignisphaera sp. 4213-co]|uniref:Uncharacterized protein n=1 Tax=Ignisphaera cupida TaxID=3050454 RepID=A0ABD4Z4K0_9CREN|nr:hypothetical protein [Ignisphaera sp. 4213-co]MDK6028236.1 hypothetical protein [Ignisphaera sp. 4213-co]
MKQHVFGNELIGLMASTAYEIPSVVGFSDLPFVGNAIVKKTISMYMDEATKYVYDVIGLKPLSLNLLMEDAYALCNNESLVYIGRFVEGLIPAHEIYSQYKSQCKSTIFLHSHPIPLPLPSPEDILSAYQLDYEAECVISKVSKSKAVLTCIKPMNGWKDVIYIFNALIEKVLEISQFIVVGNKDKISFLPFPTEKEINEIISYSKKRLEPYAHLIHVDIDLLNGTYNLVYP